MALSPYFRGLRERVGNALLVLPSVAVLVSGESGRLLFVRDAGTLFWQTPGGVIEPDESPWDAAVRESAEEAGVEIRIEAIRTVLGGPQFRVEYPNGDVISCVTTVFDAHVVGGEARADMDETVEVGWFSLAELGRLELSPFTVAMLEAVYGSERARYLPAGSAG